MTVFCEWCDFVHSDTRKLPPYRWRCIKVKIHPRGYKFVSETFAPNPPYERCEAVNHDGQCELFEPIRQLNKPENKDAA
jgi:hypothetical protein